MNEQNRAFRASLMADEPSILECLQGALLAQSQGVVCRSGTIGSAGIADRGSEKPRIRISGYGRWMCVTPISKYWPDIYRIGYGKDVTEAYAAWERQV